MPKPTKIWDDHKAKYPKELNPPYKDAATGEDSVSQGITARNKVYQASHPDVQPYLPSDTDTGNTLDPKE